MSEEREIVVTSLYGVRTQQPRVQLSCQAADFTVQMGIREAREIAEHLLEACAAAEFDAVLVGWLADMGLDQQRQGQALQGLRERLKEVRKDEHDH